MAEEKLIGANIKVCVTGASGFIAAHCIQQLLQQGYIVHGTVRSTKQADKIAHITNLPHAQERLHLFEADLLAEAAFDQAIAGCDYVLHTASPYTMTAKDPQKDLVEPALQGTLNVLRSIKKAGSVKRVVLTSSVAAITDSPDPNHVYTEADWNVSSSLERNPYYYSKKLAEEAAWKYAQEEKLDLVVINPFVVIGPCLSKEVNPSAGIIRDIFNGAYPAIMDFTWGMVDVRDVARAHVLAIQVQQAKGRYLCANQPISMHDLVEMLKKHYSEFKLPSMSLNGAVGTQLAKMTSYFQPGQIGQYIRTNIARPVRFDHSKAEKELGLQFIDLEESVKATTDDMLYWGHINDIRPHQFSAQQLKQLYQELSAKLALSEYKSKQTFLGSQLLDSISAHLHSFNKTKIHSVANDMLKQGLFESSSCSLSSFNEKEHYSNKQTA